MMIRIRKIIHRLIYPVLLLLFLPTGGMAQRESLIHGKVVDRKTGDPIHFANVFLSNTTLGSATSPDGTFEIAQISLGSYQLVIHHIGYETEIVNVDLLTEKKLDLVIPLNPRILSGEPVEVVARREKSWNKHLRSFREGLFGKTQNARHCEIHNPEVLNFREYEGWLYAETDSLLHLTNRALGYRIELILESFRCTPDEKKYQIHPVFHPMEPAGEGELIRWKKQRLKTYKGSFRHLLASVYHQSLDSEGLELYEVKHVGNKIYTWGSTDRVKDISSLVRTSDFPDLMETGFRGHYMVLSPYIPRKTDRFIEEAQQTGFYQLEFYEPCFFSRNRDSALIDTRGNIHTPNAFSISGYWAVYGVADMLPFSYQPDP